MAAEIPKFSEYESIDNTTQKFEAARKQNQTGISSHPNAPRRSPLHPSAHTPESRDPKPKPKHPPHPRRPEADPTRPTESPQHRQSAPRRSTSEHGGGDAATHRAPHRAAPGAASPLQPAGPAKPKHRAGGMQTPERRASAEGHGPHTPGRGRRKHGGRGPEAPEEEAIVPPFGGWDESNAESGEKYTDIFRRVRNDALSPNSSARQPSSTHPVQQSTATKQTCPCCIL